MSYSHPVQSHSYHRRESETLGAGVCARVCLCMSHIDMIRSFFLAEDVRGNGIKEKCNTTQCIFAQVWKTYSHIITCLFLYIHTYVYIFFFINVMTLCTSVSFFLLSSLFLSSFPDPPFLRSTLLLHSPNTQYAKLINTFFCHVSSPNCSNWRKKKRQHGKTN